jgi:hypothetical protein
MGYTHYWTQTRSFTAVEWSEVCTDIAAILSYVEHGCDIPLANGHGEPGTHPVIDADDIMFNGVDNENDDAHETMVVSRKREKAWEGGTLGWACTKTARKPYDLAVTAVLCYLSSVAGTHSVSSDGNGSNFVAGLAAAREALPNKANILDIPMGVMEADRWTGPWISGQKGSGYSVNFCVNGKAYVTHLKSGDVRCFQTHGDLGKFLDANKTARFARGGTSVFGGYGRVEPNIWYASGSFDKARHERIAKAQAKILKQLFPVPAEHAEKPPAYVRPDTLVRPEDNGTFCYSLADLMQKVAA